MWCALVLLCGTADLGKGVPYALVRLEGPLYWVAGRVGGRFIPDYLYQAVRDRGVPEKEWEGKVHWLLGHLHVDSLGDKGLFRVWLDEGSFRERTLWADAVARAYVKKVNARHREELRITLRACQREYVKVLEYRKAPPGSPDGTHPREARRLCHYALEIETLKRQLELGPPAVLLEGVPK